VGGGRAFLSRGSIASALKVPTVLLFVGGMMFLSGQGLFAASFFQGADGVLATIPAGSTWAYVYPIKVLGAGRVFGDFADPAGGLVEIDAQDDDIRPELPRFGSSAGGAREALAHGARWWRR